MKPRVLPIIFCAAWLCGPAWGAVITVCSSGCSTSLLQTAFDSTANCGDTIQIKSIEPQIGNFTITNRGCGSNPITVTSDRAAWLPPPTARITPSHFGNMAKIATRNSLPALADVLDGAGQATAGWNFVGVAFYSTGPGVYHLIGFNNNGDRTGPTQIPDKITFDRCYFYMNPVSAGGSIQDVMRADATHLTVKNSFFGDAFWNGFVESHAIHPLTSAGPVTVTNTFITTSGIPIFVGGAVPSYPTYLENGMTAQFNYFWRPWKWNGDPAQPYAADYAAAGGGTLRTGPYPLVNITNTGVITLGPSTDYATPPFIPGSLLTITGAGGCTTANAAGWRIASLTASTFQLQNFPGCNAAYTGGGSVSEYAISPCTKNLGELKYGNGILWQYNVGENSWASTACQSQFTGFTDTLRTQWDSSLLSPAIGTFSMSDQTHVNWSGTYRIGDVNSGGNGSTLQDLSICLSLPGTGTECHPIASQGGASLVSAAPFSSAPAGPLNGWIGYTGSAKLTNTVISHNVWKNTDQPYSVLALSFANGVGDAGFGKNHTISQNLAYVDTPYVQGVRGMILGAGEADYNFNPSGYVFDHNTFYYPNGLNGPFVYLGGTNCTGCATTIQPKFDVSAITNNLFGVTSTGGNGPFSGDGTGTVAETADSYFLNSSIRNNAIPGEKPDSMSITGGNSVSGNFSSPWADPFGGMASRRIFNVTGGPYFHAGTDGASLGADFTQLPLVNNLQVTPSTGSATLAFDVSSPNNAVKTTQPCVLEVSANRNLSSDLGSYTVIPNVDPTVAIGADLSTRGDVTLSGNHVTWPLAGLAAGVNYYGRVMCYGDTEWFTFQTLPGTGTLACDVNHDGLLNVQDVQLMANQALGLTACTSNLSMTGICSVVDAQRVINAALGLPCVVGP